jgi:hypothetical protein
MGPLGSQQATIQELSEKGVESETPISLNPCPPLSPKGGIKGEGPAGHSPPSLPSLRAVPLCLKGVMERYARVMHPTLTNEDPGGLELEILPMGPVNLRFKKAAQRASAGHPTIP